MKGTVKHFSDKSRGCDWEAKLGDTDLGVSGSLRRRMFLGTESITPFALQKVFPASVFIIRSR